MVSNANFIGMLYASLFVPPQRILMWSYGISLYSQNKQEKSLKKIVLHPCVISIFIGIIVMIAYNLHIYLPTGISKTIKMIGSCSTPLCLIVVGTFASDLRFRELINKHIILFSIYRLIMIPCIIFILFLIFPVNRLCRNVCVLLTAIPAATATVLLAKQYSVNALFATKVLVLSSLLSILTIPFVTYLLEIV